MSTRGPQLPLVHGDRNMPIRVRHLLLGFSHLHYILNRYYARAAPPSMDLAAAGKTSWAPDLIKVVTRLPFTCPELILTHTTLVEYVEDFANLVQKLMLEWQQAPQAERLCSFCKTEVESGTYPNYLFSMFLWFYYGEFGRFATPRCDRKLGCRDMERSREDGVAIYMCRCGVLNSISGPKIHEKSTDAHTQSEYKEEEHALKQARKMPDASLCMAESPFSFNGFTECGASPWEFAARAKRTRQKKNEEMSNSRVGIHTWEKNY
ncbi:hypothetical protein C8F04DRAFT_1178992 [Mycena alexandri]|uniref:Uncharacterized protein n=1 Tax=Mycena alexandri TaxID=1745969 RepID=A0AAD6T6S8_9AGAR|nr:hypothetical protein C8F04DRAFT_1178992 [Mycena alexandri]